MIHPSFCGTLYLFQEMRAVNAAFLEVCLGELSITQRIGEFMTGTPEMPLRDDI
jgi:hypothetical protein